MVYGSFLLLCFILYQSNFATLDESTGVVTSRRADRHFEEEGPVLCAALDGLKLPSFPQYEVRVRCMLFQFLHLLAKVYALFNNSKTLEFHLFTSFWFSA